MPTSLFSDSDTIVENALPLTRWGLLIAYDSLSAYDTDSSLLAFDTSFVATNAAGCDSSVDLSLRVLRNRQTVLDTAVCAAGLPLTWHGVVFDSADFDLLLPPPLHHSDTLLLAASTGADSVVVL